MMRIALFLLCAAIPVCARSPRPVNAPVERLIRNTTEFLRQHPSDARAYYLLGRLHSYIFAQIDQAPVGPSRDGSGLMDLEDRSDTGPARESRAVMPSDQRRHFYATVENYRRAIRLSPESPLYHFALAWMDQQGAEFSEDLGRDSSCFLREALKEYREAYRLASEAPVQSPAAFSPIFAAAGQRIIGILDDRYPASDHSSDALAAKAEMLSIEENLKTGGRPRHVENAVISSR